jgi:hypothetical protein
MLRFPLNEEWIKWATDAVGEASVVQAIQDEIGRRSGGNQTRFFASLATNPATARGLWQRAVDPVHRKILSTGSLTKFLRLLQPDIEVSTAGEPWARWRPGWQVAVIVGQRAVRIDEVSAVKRRAVGARDSEALAEFIQILNRQLKLDCEVVLHHVPASLPSVQAKERLAAIQRNPTIGMVCVIGSPVVNPMANEIAANILSRPGLAAPPNSPW